MERKLKRKCDVLLPNLNKKNKVNQKSIYDEIYGEINNIKYDIFLYKQNQKSFIEKTLKKMVKEEIKKLGLKEEINKLKETISKFKEIKNYELQIEELKDEINSLKYEIEAILLNKNFEKKMQLGPELSYIN